MELEAAKMIGAGLAAIALAGAGVGIGIIFGNYLSGAMRNPSAAQKQFPNLLLVEIKTDEGSVGLGETFYGPASAEAHIHEIIAPYLLGKDPLNIELHQKNLIGYTGFIGAPIKPV